MRVELASNAEKQLAKITSHIVKKFALWVDLVSVEGWHGLFPDTETIF